jgi:hypothetical protein
VRYIDDNGVEYLGAGAVEALCRDHIAARGVMAQFPKSWSTSLAQTAYGVASMIRKKCFSCGT